MSPRGADGETYLVVGASGSIGSAVARGLAGEGVSLGLHYCGNQTAIEQLRSELEPSGTRCVPLQSSLANSDSCLALVDQLHRQVGAPSGVALCTGRVPWKPWQEIAGDDWTGAFFEHCIAPFVITRRAAESMRSRGDGRIAFLSSIAAKYGGSPRSLHYAAAKGALEITMHGLAREVASAGIRINGVRAGFVDTPQQRAGRTPKEIAERIQKIILKRAGKPEEIAAAIVFLLSPAASFMTGEILTVAGGD